MRADGRTKFTGHILFSNDIAIFCPAGTIGQRVRLLSIRDLKVQSSSLWSGVALFANLFSFASSTLRSLR